MDISSGGPALIVGLGNPGMQYEYTRHNIGFLLIKAYANKLRWKLKRAIRLKARHASGTVLDRELHLMMPGTYMNLSGTSVRRGVQKFKITQPNLLVVVDDVHLPFGHFRFREKGSSGGHNGLKSIEDELHSQDFARLRVGVGSNGNEDLAEYVLSSFEDEEMKKLPIVLEGGMNLLDIWLKEDTKLLNEEVSKTKV